METFKGAGCDSRLLSFALRNGLIITSGRGGQHNVGSKHYRGLAIDVSVRHNRAGAPLTEDFISHLKRDCEAHGLLLRDERTRPPGQVVWGGPHVHVEVI